MIELIENYDYSEIEELRKQENYYKMEDNIISADNKHDKINDNTKPNKIINNNTSNIIPKSSFLVKSNSSDIMKQVNFGC